MHSLPVEPAVIEFRHCPLCILLPPELNIDIAHEVVPEVVTHIHLFNLSILLLQFCEYLLQKIGKSSTKVWYTGNPVTLATLTSKKLS